MSMFHAEILAVRRRGLWPDVFRGGRKPFCCRVLAVAAKSGLFST